MAKKCDAWQLLCRWENRGDGAEKTLTDTIPQNIMDNSKNQLYLVAGTGLLILFLLR